MGRAETDIIILGHFLQGPAHGYELKRRIDQSFGNTYINIINSLLYPRLAELERDGYIEGHREMQEKVPDRKVYQITDAGRKHMRELVATPIKIKKGVLPDLMDLTVHAVFFFMITKEEREKVTRPYYEAYMAVREKGHDALKKYGPKMDPFSRTMTEWGVEYVDSGIKVLEKLQSIDNEVRPSYFPADSDQEHTGGRSRSIRKGRPE
jgi:DNA-binding PadR family transcriptional regulator